jgi:hypothetical protein
MERVVLGTSGSLALAGVVLLATGFTSIGVLCIAACSIPCAGYACLNHSCAHAPPPVVVVDEDPRPVSQNDVLS